MVSTGLSFRGKGALRFAPSGTKINAAEHIEIIRNAYLEDCIELYGEPPTCLFRQGWASSRTASVKQGYLASVLPKFWRKEGTAAKFTRNEPARLLRLGYLQAQAGKMKPTCLDALKVAINQAVRDMPPDVVQSAR